MGNINVAVLGRQEYAKSIGKAGTSSDITFYNLKRGEDTVTFIEPSRYPDRLAPLYFSVSMADEALVVVDEITPLFGEIAVMLDVLGVEKGYIVLGNYLDPSQITPLLKGTVLESYTFLEDNEIALREQFLDDAAGKVQEAPGPSGGGVVSIDHHFNVKGIGTVILGGVERGIIHRHDTVQVLPGEKTAQIRSIQKHDDDANDAVAGDRVGLALKNIGDEELDRGHVLSTDDEIVTGECIEGRVVPVRFWKEPFRKGMVLHVGHWMQFVPGRVDEVTGSPGEGTLQLSIHLDRPLIYFPGDRVVLHYLEGGALRIVGSLTLA